MNAVATQKGPIGWTIAQWQSAYDDGATPDTLLGREGLMALSVEASAGDWRAGDQVWLRRFDAAEIGRGLNRDVLAPRPGGRFAFGRMIDHRDGRVALLPPGPGQRQLVIDRPAWIAVAEVLVRPL